MGSFHVSLFAILSRPSSPPPLSRRRRRHRCALCVFLHFSTANAHFFFFLASVELSKRFESNGSSLKFFFTMVARTNNENARSLARDLSHAISRFARFLRASYPCRTRCVRRPVRFETESTRASEKRTRISWTHIKNTRSNFI